jgi:membrane protein required for colicin V production
MDAISFSGLNYVDIAIIVIFLISIIIGLARGLASELLSLIIVIAAFAVAIAFTGPLAEYFSHTSTIQNMMKSAPSGADAAQTISYMTICISFLLLFVATIIVGSIIKLLLRFVMSGTGFGFGNRLLGGIFGLVRAYLFILAAIFLVQLSPLAKQDWWQQSQYVPKFQPQVAWLGKIVSPVLDNLKSTFGPAIQPDETSSDAAKDKAPAEKAKKS